MGFSDSSYGKESACNAGDLGSFPELGRSPGEGERLPTPVFWPGESHGLHSPWGLKEADTTWQLDNNGGFLKTKIYGLYSNPKAQGFLRFQAKLDPVSQTG